ncbi:MAG TPA: NAD(P)-dependent oxidoreductase [Anaerolineae bacterium]|nr:NAD(P)-dependent oxidoreductase [Anaerolineae bacterium]
MRVVIIGGTGHVGTYLVPRLVEAGHEVISLSRGHAAGLRRSDGRLVWAVSPPPLCALGGMARRCL